VLVASDHGIGEYDGYGFHVNDYLRDHGYVETVRGGTGMPSWTAVRRDVRDGDAETRAERVLSRATALAARVGLTSQRIGAVLERAGVDDVVVRHVPTEAIRAGTEQVDFARSRAYMRSRLELGVRINLRGREPEGTVSPDEYDEVRQELVSLLRDVRTPDGDPVFESVRPREEVFHGPYVEDAPDVVTVPSGYDHLPTASLLGSAFGPPPEPWEHKPIGVVAATGVGVDPGAGLGDAHIFDVAPTVLATLGLPAPERMDGKPLPFVEPAGTESYPAYEPQSRTGTDDRSVERRLADLGYLE
jgi:predicted AlkP superfamily phosphohydrolase/phosphomutase